MGAALRTVGTLTKILSGVVTILSAASMYQEAKETGFVTFGNTRLLVDKSDLVLWNPTGERSLSGNQIGYFLTREEAIKMLPDQTTVFTYDTGHEVQGYISNGKVQTIY